MEYDSKCLSVQSECSFKSLVVCELTTGAPGFVVLAIIMLRAIEHMHHDHGSPSLPLTEEHVMLKVYVPILNRTMEEWLHSSATKQLHVVDHAEMRLSVRSARSPCLDRLDQ